MKVFTTLATVLGLTHANPTPFSQAMGDQNAVHFRGNEGMRQMSSHGPVVQQKLASMTPQMKTVQVTQKAISPNQYFIKNDMGNYAFGYSTLNSQRAEEGSDRMVRGQYAYINGDGKLRHVEYLANDDGFHILRDTADTTGRYIKRSAEGLSEPDLIKTRMTSILDSTSLRDDNLEMYNMPNNMMGRDRTPSRMQQRNNQRGTQQMLSNLYQPSNNRNMMGQDISYNMIGQDMSADMLRNMDRFSDRRGQDRLTKMRQNTMRDEEMSDKMMGRPKMSQYRSNKMQDSNTMESQANRMDQDTSSRQVNQMRGIDMSNKVVNPALVSQDIYSNPLLTYNIMSQPITNLMTPMIQPVAVPQMIQAPVYTTPLTPYHVPIF